jgi:hypothetical protein
VQESQESKAPVTPSQGSSNGILPRMAFPLLVSCLSLLACGCPTVFEPEIAPDHRPVPADLPRRLRSHVEVLAARIGERNCYRRANLAAAASWIEQDFRSNGYETRRLAVPVPAGPPFECGPLTVWNIEATKRGGSRADEIVIVGAHYDSKVATPEWNDHGPPLPDRPGTPGADDNASGVSALLEIARLLAKAPAERTVRFVAFVNEEPPFFKTDCMGSLVYARECAKKDAGKIVGAIVLEQVGCYSIRPRTKRPWFAGLVGIPDRPDYVAFFSNFASRHWTEECGTLFHRHSNVEVRCISPPDFTGSLSWSDDWSFWQEDLPAFSVCDTTYMRHDDYHELDDTADRLDYATMADVAWGLLHVVRELANPGEAK